MIHKPAIMLGVSRSQFSRRRCRFEVTHTHTNTNALTCALSIIGGGFFQQDCDQGFEQKELCWLGGLSEKDSAAFILSFEENFAAASGGAVYTTCYNFGKCQAIQEKFVGLPSAEPVSVLVFDSNTAGGYGHNIGLCEARARTHTHVRAHIRTCVFA